jgi:hypothetical protein
MVEAEECYCFGRKKLASNKSFRPQSTLMLVSLKIQIRFGFYGEPKWEDNHLSWDKIRELNSQHDMPWAIMGDFNEILFSHEKEGGNPRPQGYMQAFRDVLSDCELFDLGFNGDPFTWKRGRIRERLDRVVVNNAWNTMHPEATVHHMEYARSDHRPIVLDTYNQVFPCNQNSSSFRFEAKWLHEKNFSEVVEQAWVKANEVEADRGVLEKLAHMHKSLHDWDIQVLKQPRTRIRKAQKKMEKAMNGPTNDENDKISKEMNELIEILLEQENIHWMQRSRANWLMQGDRNTSFFHQFATARRKKNLIKKLKDANGNWVEGTSMLKPLVFYYFSNLFTSEIQEIDPAVLEKVQQKVTQNMNDDLMATFSAEDVKKAAFSIGDFKAPGPDGLHAIFYKKFWGLW